MSSISGSIRLVEIDSGVCTLTAGKFRHRLTSVCSFRSFFCRTLDELIRFLHTLCSLVTTKVGDIKPHEARCRYLLTMSDKSNCSSINSSTTSKRTLPHQTLRRRQPCDSGGTRSTAPGEVSRRKLNVDLRSLTH